MFTQLALLLQNCTSLQVIMAANPDGTLSVTVLPKGKAGDKEAALNTPLSLTATPEDLDAGFVSALSGFVVSHQSLAEQISNTEAILEAAKAESQKKATAAISKSSKATQKATPAAASVSESEPEDDENTGGGDPESDNDTASSDKSETTAPATSAADSLWE